MNKRPFPQLDDSAFESPRTLVHALIASMEAADAERPHGVLVYDPETEHRYVVGPYPNAYVAAEAAAAKGAELNDPRTNDGPNVEFTVVEVVAP